MEREHLRVLLLDTRNQLIRTVEVYRGSLNSSQVRVGEIFRDAIRRNAAAIIVADASTFGAVAWYTKRDDIYVLAPGEIAYGMEYPDSRFRNLQDVGLAQLIADSRGVRDMFIVVRPENAAPVDAAVPGTASRTEAGGLVRWHIPATMNRVPNG